MHLKWLFGGKICVLPDHISYVHVSPKSHKCFTDRLNWFQMLFLYYQVT